MENTIIVPLVDRYGVVRAHTIIDASDSDLVLPFAWHLLKMKNAAGYAIRCFGSHSNGTWEKVLMHREILGLPRKSDGRQGDHINRDGLDNRRGNLRILTSAQNRQNQIGRPYGTSRYRGVSWNTKTGKWVVVVMVNNKSYWFGTFDNEDVANKAAIAARKELLPYNVEPIAS